MRSAFQPAGLLTVAGMLPENYNIKFIDTNVRRLTDRDLQWADVVISSGMIIHWDPLEEIIERANKFEVPSFVGGPIATQYADELRGNATFFRGEAETGFLDILEDIVRKGYVPERSVIDKRGEFRSIRNTPPQRFDLIRDTFNAYAAMAIQITRGCPEKCTFCNIPALFGKVTRLKDIESVIEELDLLYELGWRDRIMITDDNMVGNQVAIIPPLNAIGDWNVRHNYVYPFFGQVSLKMYENPELMDAMRYAGFGEVFIGLESPSKASLKFMGAQKNLGSSNKRGKESMLEKVTSIQRDYFRVMAGFILGFDSDPDDIADLMKEFISDSRVGIAMVGPLGVLPDTPDHLRYSRQGRLVEGERYAGDSGVFSRKLSFEMELNIVMLIDP